jgi:hydrogenase maturation protease
VGDGAVVIGVGNPERGDDGAGPEVIRRLGSKAHQGMRLVATSGSDPATIIDAWAEAGTAIVVDAMISGAVPGSVSRFDLTQNPLPSAVRLVSTHALGATTAIELARALGRLPGRLIVYGIEAGTMGDGSGLSPPVSAAVDAAVRMIVEEADGA